MKFKTGDIVRVFTHYKGVILAEDDIKLRTDQYLIRLSIFGIKYRIYSKYIKLDIEYYRKEALKNILDEE